MAGRLIETKGSGDFEKGPSGVSAQGLATCIGCEDQEEAYALAAAYFPEDVSGIPRGSIKPSDQGGGVFLIEVDYSSSVISAADPATGTPPEPIGPEGGGTPSPGGGNPPEGSDGSEEVGREISFALGGKTRHLRLCRRVVSSYNTAGALAPDTKKIIGLTKDGPRGSTAFPPGGKFTLTLKLDTITKGYFARMAAWVGDAVNDAPFQGLDDVGEVLLLQIDGHFKDGDGWNISFTFEYSPNNTADNPILLRLGDDVVDTEIQKLGHEYLDVAYEPHEHDFPGVRKVVILRPVSAYVEEIFPLRDFGVLGV